MTGIDHDDAALALRRHVNGLDALGNQRIKRVSPGMIETRRALETVRCGPFHINDQAMIAARRGRIEGELADDNGRMFELEHNAGARRGIVEEAKTVDEAVSDPLTRCEIGHRPARLRQVNDQTVGQAIQGKGPEFGRLGCFNDNARGRGFHAKANITDLLVREARSSDRQNG